MLGRQDLELRLLSSGYLAAKILDLLLGGYVGM